MAAADFTDIIQANRTYASTYQLGGLEARAARGLGVLTCMDSRLDPLAMLGLARGDAKIIRNAGARVTDEVLRTIVVARYLLQVDRLMVVAHTGCKMASGNESAVHRAITEAGGPDTRSLSILATTDQRAALMEDIQRVRSSPYLPGLTVGGFIFDLHSGILEPVC